MIFSILLKKKNLEKVRIKLGKCYFCLDFQNANKMESERNRFLFGDFPTHFLFSSTALNVVSEFI